jgi:hypothetical protein
MDNLKLYQIEVIGKNKRKPIEYEIDKNGCWNCISHFKNNSYPMIRINYKSMKMSRYIYERFIEVIPEGLMIRHKCDNPSCINPEHLEVGTNKDNMDDMVKRNRSLKGDKCKRRKVTQLQVNEIRKDRRQYKPIATQYGISVEQVTRIKNMLSWRQ